jgi:hypothetical protein
MSPVPLPRRRRSRNRAATARRSRCCSRTLSAFCGSVDCACEAQAVRSSSSRWQRSHRTCVDLQSWLLDRRRLRRLCALHERRVQFVASMVLVCQSCRSAGSASASKARRGGQRDDNPTFATKSATRRLMHRSKRRAGCNVYSITSSASASSVGGISRPSILAVLRLIANSNLVDCMTGRSPGLSPLRIRPA